MSVDATRQVYGWLASSSAITTLIPKSDIHISYPKLEDNFPCISITQAAGTDYGYLGYGTASAGSKLRREEPTIQIDIWSKTGFYQTDQAADEVTKVMISGTCRKQSDNNDYNDDIGLYRKIMSFTYVKFFED